VEWVDTLWRDRSRSVGLLARWAVHLCVCKSFLTHDKKIKKFKKTHFKTFFSPFSLCQNPTEKL